MNLREEESTTESNDDSVYDISGYMEDDAMLNDGRVHISNGNLGGETGDNHRGQISEDQTDVSRSRHYNETLHGENNQWKPHVAGSVPPPHLPLKKRSAEQLRAGNLQIRRARDDAGRGGMMNSVESDTTVQSRLNARSELSDISGDDRANTSRPTTPSSPIGSAPSRTTLYRSSSFTKERLHPREHAALLRTSMSIPNLGMRNSSFRNDSAPCSFGGSSNARSSSKSNRRNGTLWRDIVPESARGSYRSALTNASSAFDINCTERSSTLTDRSSSSEYPNIVTGWPVIREEDLMSIEDVYGMYEDGFSDDAVDEMVLKQPVKPTTSAHLAPRRQTRPADLEITRPESHTLPIAVSSTDRAAQNSSSDLTLTPPTNDTAVHHLPIRIVYENDELPPTPRFPITTIPYVARDRYGFKKESQHITVKQYDTWNVAYTEYLERRRSKWVVLMQHSHLSVDDPTEFPAKSDKVKRYVRKGIPPQWRGAAWFHYAGGPAAVARNPGLYQNLVKRAENGDLGEDDREHIERDLHRTFPDNIKFKPDARKPLDVSTTNLPLSPLKPPEAEPAMIRSLRQVLQAFATHQPKIGYCQSLNFLAGHLLLFLSGDEEKAFHLLCILTREHLPGTHGIALEGANVDIGVLMFTIKQTMPAVWSKIDDRPPTTQPATLRSDPYHHHHRHHRHRRDSSVITTKSLPTVSLATTPWFMSCFVSTLPPETVARVWDVLFYEGSKTLFRVALGVFRLAEPQMRAQTDPMEVFQVVQTLPRTLLDANRLMDVALRKGSKAAWAGAWGSGGGLMSQDVVDRRRGERRAMYASERIGGGVGVGVAVARAATTGPVSGDVRDGEVVVLRSASSKSRLKRFRSKAAKSK